MEQVLVKGVTPIKILLATLFCVLGLGEFFDGIYDVGDYAVPLFILLILHDIYVQLRIGRPLILKENDFSKREWPKWIMNGIFFLLFISPVFMEMLGWSPVIRAELFKLGTIAWSGTFLAISASDLKKGFKPAKVLICNIAFMLFLGSFFLV